MAHELKTADVAILSSVDQNEDKSGFRTSYTYTGTRQQCEQQRLLERTRGAKQLQLRPKGDGNWELVTTYPVDAEDGGNGDSEQPSETHELEVSMAQQDVWTNTKLNAALLEANIYKLKALVDRYKNGDPAMKTPEKAYIAVYTEIGTGAQGDLAVDYFEQIALKGVDHWIFYRQVYSKTITVATPRQVQASFEGVQKIWTTAQLLAWERLPSDWWFQLPTDTKWHKSMPRISTNIGKSAKTQINYQYIGSDEASTLLYDNY